MNKQPELAEKSPMNPFCYAPTQPDVIKFTQRMKVVARSVMPEKTQGQVDIETRCRRGSAGGRYWLRSGGC